MLKFRTIDRLSNLNKLLKNFGINPYYLLIPIFLSFAAALFEGFSAGLLIPLLKGIIQMNFRFVLDLPVAKGIFDWFSVNFGIKIFPIFFILVTIIFASSIMKDILQYASAVIVALQVRRLSYELRANIFKRYLSFGKTYFDRNNSGHLQNVLMGFTQSLSSQLLTLQSFFNNALSLIVYVAIMSVISWKLTLIVFIIAFILYNSLESVLKLIKNLSKVSAESEKSLARKASNIISCMSLVKLYSQEKNEMKKFAHISSVVRDVGFGVDREQNLLPAIHDIATLIAVLLIASIMVFMVKKQNISEVSVLSLIHI